MERIASSFTPKGRQKTLQSKVCRATKNSKSHSLSFRTQDLNVPCDFAFSQETYRHCVAHVKKIGLRCGVEKRLTVKEGNKLNSERSCLVLLSAPLYCTQLLPKKHSLVKVENIIKSFIFNFRSLLLLCP